MPANKYSDTLLADALRGSLSNVESLGRGFGVAPIGLIGDINALARQYITPRLPQSVQGLLQSAPAAPTTEQILSNIPRITAPRMETSGMEQMGAAMNPRGPVDLARGVGRLAGSEINAAMLGERGGLLGAVTPQPLYVAPNITKNQIQASAESLADTLNSLGFKADVTHSGSKAGASSYVNIFDPQTGRFFNKQIRFSGHGKGPKEASGVIDIQNLETDIPKIIDAANNMRLLGPSKQYQIETKANELIASGIKPKSAYKQAQEYIEKPPFTYPQQEALDLAQQRAALPVEQGGLGLPANNTPMDRARALGFDIDVYHGTKADILNFDPTKPVFSSPNPEIANFYSQGANANIMPLMLRGKELSISDLSKSGVSGSFAENLAKKFGIYDKNDPFNLSDIRERELINQLPKYEIDRLKITDMSDMGGIQTQYAIPSGSSNIRSRFAAFDPWRRTAATAGLFGVAAPDLLAQPTQPIDYGLLSP